MRISLITLEFLIIPRLVPRDLEELHRTISMSTPQQTLVLFVPMHRPESAIVLLHEGIVSFLQSKGSLGRHQRETLGRDPPASRDTAQLTHVTQFDRASEASGDFARCWVEKDKVCHHFY